MHSVRPLNTCLRNEITQCRVAEGITVALLGKLHCSQGSSLHHLDSSVFSGPSKEIWTSSWCLPPAGPELFSHCVQRAHFSPCAMLSAFSNANLPHSWKVLGLTSHRSRQTQNDSELRLYRTHGDVWRLVSGELNAWWSKAAKTPHWQLSCRSWPSCHRASHLDWNSSL